jgi:hypothetical protein
MEAKSQRKDAGKTGEEANGEPEFLYGIAGALFPGRWVFY